MAKFIVQGTITCVKYLQDAVLVYLDEYKKGYRKADGERVDEKCLSWKIIYKGYFKGYISKYFGEGMVVEAVGDLLPYAIEKDRMVDGYSCIGKELDLYSSPRPSLRAERRMIKDSQLHSDGEPDLEGYEKADF